MSWPTYEKMGKTSVKIEIGCRDDTVPKTIEARRHCEESSTTPYVMAFGGCGRLLHALNPLLVSIVFGTVSALLFTLVYLQVFRGRGCLGLKVSTYGRPGL